MRLWLPYPFATVCCIVTLIIPALTLSACSGTVAPPAPSAVEQAPSDISPISHPAALVTTSRTVNTFPLVNGSFTLTLAASDGSVGTVKGTYSGEAIVSEHGVPTATLQLQITDSSGIGSTIAAIEADGTRAFAGGGDFALSMLLTTSLTKSPMRVTLRGTSQVSCSAMHRIQVTMHGTDSTRGFLEITGNFQHEVGNTGCGP
jgi:hypothetical protein